MGTNKGFDNLETKLKYCCAEDKEDIFEFIFLDLCIELYQEPCNENKIMKCTILWIVVIQIYHKIKMYLYRLYLISNLLKWVLKRHRAQNLTVESNTQNKHCFRNTENINTFKFSRYQDLQL
mgnify:CR=1 FL=1